MLHRDKIKQNLKRRLMYIEENQTLGINMDAEKRELNKKLREMDLNIKDLEENVIIRWR